MEGIGLHTGACVRVALEVCAGAVRLEVDGVEATMDELTVTSGFRATTVEAHQGRLRVETVEHLMGALAGLGVRRGARISVDAGEMPLLDGGAAVWCDAISQLGLPSDPPRSRVAREAIIRVGSSRYELAPSDQIEVHVDVEFNDSRITPLASWRGDPWDFRTRIAPARTFGFSHEIDLLLRSRLAQHVDPTSVILVAPDAIHHAGRPFLSDEPARHKLLDLVGDLYLHGGPPVGSIRAFRPGHAATAQALRQARDSGVLVSR